MRPRLRPVFFGEGIEVNPEPTHEIRCNSEVTYASEKHFRDNVYYAHVPTVTAYSETIVAAPNCTWRNYRSQLTLEPRPRALRFGCTTIIFPKRARSSFRTTLHCSLGRARRRFTASVQLQPGSQSKWGNCQEGGDCAPPPLPPPLASRVHTPGSPGVRQGMAISPSSRAPWFSAATQILREVLNAEQQRLLVHDEGIGDTLSLSVALPRASPRSPQGTF
ncbi:PREDICTED: filamin-interacting protein FAM101A [Miniopterus natalensis]|uniref:filamin-interacting protein FAM101A n=1 Tax=Miniopterus natalensis TaxID=291302 RepID=UPI0007A6D698|nr:PREDICTED: filamin-interacting protein FAM101A [Miniopterus natalensis]